MEARKPYDLIPWPILQIARIAEWAACSFPSALCNWPVRCGAKITSTFNWKVFWVYLCLRNTFQLSAKPLFLCLQEYFEVQVFNSIFVVNTTFSGVGKQTSAPTGNGLTGYQARPSFADSCWAFALTNPSGLTSTSLPLPEGSADLWTAGNWSQHSAAHPKQICWHLWGKFPHLIEAQLWLSCIDRGAISRILSSFYWQLRSKYGPPRSLMGDADNLCR